MIKGPIEWPLLFGRRGRSRSLGAEGREFTWVVGRDFKVVLRSGLASTVEFMEQDSLTGWFSYFKASAVDEAGAMRLAETRLRRIQAAILLLTTESEARRSGHRRRTVGR